MTKIYPDDARLDVNGFSVSSTVQYNNTGASQTSFLLPTPVSIIGQVLAIADGTIQPYTSYALADLIGGLYANVSFTTAPNASNLTLKSIAVPSSFYVQRQGLTVHLVEYANTPPTTVNGNNYVTDGARVTFALPQNSSTTNKDSILMAVSGVTQTRDHFTFPSATLSYQGLDLDLAPTNVDTVSIRVFNSTAIVYDRRQSMVDRKPDKGFDYTTEIQVKTNKYYAGYEKRRLISRKPKRTWMLTYTNITAFEKIAVENFYRARNGEFQAFILDLEHLNEVGTAIVRFDGTLSLTHILSAAAGDLYRNIWTVAFKLLEVDD